CRPAGVAVHRGTGVVVAGVVIEPLRPLGERAQLAVDIEIAEVLPGRALELVEPDAARLGGVEVPDGIGVHGVDPVGTEPLGLGRPHPLETVDRAELLIAGLGVVGLAAGAALALHLELVGPHLPVLRGLDLRHHFGALVPTTAEQGLGEPDAAGDRCDWNGHQLPPVYQMITVYAPLTIWKSALIKSISFAPESHRFKASCSAEGLAASITST